MLFSRGLVAKKRCFASYIAARNAVSRVQLASGLSEWLEIFQVSEMSSWHLYHFEGPDLGDKRARSDSAYVRGGVADILQSSARATDLVGVFTL